MEEDIDKIIAKRNNWITTVFASVFLAIAACSGVAIYFFPFIGLVKSPLFDGTHNWIYAVPVAPSLIGGVFLYQALQLAKASLAAAQELAGKLKDIAASKS